MFRGAGQRTVRLYTTLAWTSGATLERHDVFSDVVPARCAQEDRSELAVVRPDEIVGIAVGFASKNRRPMRTAVRLFPRRNPVPRRSHTSDDFVETWEPQWSRR